MKCKNFMSQCLMVCACFGILGCESAHSGELSSGESSVVSSSPQQRVIKRRPTYITPEVQEKLWIRIAEGMMRQPVSENRRTFFRTEAEKSTSFSIGDTRDGYMVNGQNLPMPSLLVRQLPVQYERGLTYASGDMIELFVDTGRAMEKQYPDTIMYIGNMSAREGGDIPYSVSHNSGRDADIAFYLKDAHGNFAHPQNLHKINRRFQTREPGSSYTFDLEKNTTLIEHLLTHPKVHVQFIFLAKHLRTAIQRELVKRGSSPELLERFEMSVQNQAAHDDHFHVRIYCSNTDICAGCIDKSVIHPWHEDPLPKREQCIQRYASQLKKNKTEPIQKAVALQRLALLDAAPAHKNLIIKHLSHADADVRKAAAMAGQSLDASISKALITQLGKESDLSVRLAMIQTLAKFDKDSTRQTFIAELGRWATRTEGSSSDEIAQTIFHYMIRHPHESYAQPLLTTLHAFHTEPKVDSTLSALGDAVQALSVVINVEIAAPTLEESIHNAQIWLDQNQGKTRQQWLISGFKNAGFNVTTLENADIPVLLDAIDGPLPVSFNAQLLLKKLSRLKQDSLSWPIEDARWHYTRYFKRRAKKFRIDLSDRNERGIKLNADVQP